MKHFRIFLFVMLFACCSATPIWAEFHSEKIYVSEDDLMQTEDGKLYAQLEDEILPIAELYSDEDGLYIVPAASEGWICMCCYREKGEWVENAGGNCRSCGRAYARCAR